MYFASAVIALLPHHDRLVRGSGWGARFGPCFLQARMSLGAAGVVLRAATFSERIL